MILLKLFFFAIFTVAFSFSEEQNRCEDEADDDFKDLQLTSLRFLDPSSRYSERLKELTKTLLGSTKPDKEKVAIINEYVDDLLPALNSYIERNDLDPIDLQGFEASFQWTIFVGWVLLDDGLLKGLSTFTRTGDVTVHYEYPDLKITIPLGFSNLAFDYNYEVKFMYLGPSGEAKGTSKGNKFEVDLSIDLTTLRAKLDRFRLQTLGSVSLKFSGNILTDWIINLILAVVTPILKPLLGLVVEGYVVDGLQKVLDEYNNTVCFILGDC